MILERLLRQTAVIGLQEKAHAARRGHCHCRLCCIAFQHRPLGANHWAKTPMNKAHGKIVAATAAVVSAAILVLNLSAAPVAACDCWVALPDATVAITP